MDNTANPQNEHSDGERAAQEPASAQAKSLPQSEKGLLDTLGEAMRGGPEDARTVAENAIPKVKSAAAGAVYWTAYGVSFAAVFHWTMAKGLGPESLKTGIHDGVMGGRAAAGKWIEKLRQRKEKAADAPPQQSGPAEGAVQPGAV